MASIEQVMSIAVELLVKADRIILALFLLGCGAYELRDVFEAISHPLRIEILKLLARGPKRFADIKRELNIGSSGLLDFHLKSLAA